MPTYQCPMCGKKRVSRSGHMRRLKCDDCGTRFMTITNRVPDEEEDAKLPMPGVQGDKGGTS